MNRLEGKVALVAGGSRGIGKAIVKAFTSEGATVAFSGTSSATIAQASSQFGASGLHQGFLADLSQAQAGTQLVRAVLEHFGKVDVLVNNAGVVSRMSEWDVTPEEWNRVHDVNLRSTFFAHCALAMKGNGGGAIINGMTSNWPPDLRERLNSLTPMKRFGSPEEVTGAAVFLASNEASFITGQTLSINGGAYMG